MGHMMKVEFIQPFLDSTRNVLSTMAQTEAIPQKPFVKKGEQPIGDVTGTIGMVSKQIKGSMAISFTASAILLIASRMLGETFSEVNETIADMVGEITNMVTGGAKSLLAEKGYSFNMALPTTIVGKDHTIYHTTRNPAIVIPFETEGGQIFIELCFETI